MKKISFILVFCLALLLFSGCAEESSQENTVELIDIASAVCENGKVVVAYADGLLLELGEASELVWVFQSDKEGGVTVTAANTASGTWISDLLFSNAQESLARFGKEIVLEKRSIASLVGGTADGYRVVMGTGELDNFYYVDGTLGDNYVVIGGNGVVTGNIVYYTYGVGDAVGSYEGIYKDFVDGVFGTGNIVYRTFEVNASINAGGSLNTLLGSVSSMLNYNGKHYVVPDQCVLPLMIEDLTSLEVPATYNGEAVTKLGDRAFKGYANLETVTLPESITYLGDLLFEGCTALTKLVFEGSEEQWNAMEKAENWNSGLELQVEFAK